MLLCYVGVSDTCCPRGSETRAVCPMQSPSRSPPSVCGVEFGYVPSGGTAGDGGRGGEGRVKEHTRSGTCGMTWDQPASQGRIHACGVQACVCMLLAGFVACVCVVAELRN